MGVGEGIAVGMGVAVRMGGVGYNTGEVPPQADRPPISKQAARARMAKRLNRDFIGGLLDGS